MLSYVQVAATLQAASPALHSTPQGNVAAAPEQAGPPAPASVASSTQPYCYGDAVSPHGDTVYKLVQSRSDGGWLSAGHFGTVRIDSALPGLDLYFQDNTSCPFSFMIQTPERRSRAMQVHVQTMIGPGFEGEVAVKRAILTDEGSLEALINEVAILKHLNSHPHIARMLAHTPFCGEGRMHIEGLVLELCTGSLSGVLGERKLTTQEVHLIAEHVTAAVAHAEERGIVHCDLKPDNILINRTWAAVQSAKLTDWGVACNAGDEMTGPPGDRSYMPPELSFASDTQPVAADCRADTWGLGILFMSLVCEQPLDKVFGGWRHVVEAQRQGRVFDTLLLWGGANRCEQEWLALAQSCLSSDYTLRPTPRQLLQFMQLFRGTHADGTVHWLPQALQRMPVLVRILRLGCPLCVLSQSRQTHQREDDRPGRATSAPRRLTSLRTLAASRVGALARACAVSSFRLPTICVLPVKAEGSLGG